MNFGSYKLRIIEESDSIPFHGLVKNNSARLEDFFAGTVAKTKTEEDTRNFILDNLSRHTERKYYPFVIHDTGSHELIGFIDVKNIDWNIPKAELGCFIDRRYAGKGVSRQALELVIEFLSKDLGFKKLFLRTHETNTSARTLAEKCGFELEGTIRRDYKTTKGEMVDLLYYGMII
ncbi:MAG: GNAT family protein [Bacteroidia bacterium]|jgi:RimJ/RimL family protein N-acetyltransferase